MAEFGMPNPGPQSRFFCAAPHPGYTEPTQVTIPNGSKDWVDAPYVFCRKQKHHDGDHSAYTFSIRVPETWPNYRDEEPPF